MGITYSASSIVLVFTFYWYRYGDFFAYFTAQKNNHFSAFRVVPIAGFDSSKAWIGGRVARGKMLYFNMYGVTSLSVENKGA